MDEKNMEELQNQNNEQITTEEVKTENQNTENIQEKKQENRVVEALDKEIQRRKKELYELTSTLREIKKENESLVKKIREENLELAMKELSEKYQLSDSEKEIILSELNSRYSDVLTKEKLLDLAKSSYYSLNPDKLKEIEEQSEKVEKTVNEFYENQIKSSSSQSDVSGSEFSQEELAIMKKYNIKPETMKKIKEGKFSYSLTENSEKPYF